MQILQIIALLDKYTAKHVVLLCHHNADPDAICAAFALARLLEHLRPQISIEIGAAQGPSRLSKLLLEVLPIELTKRPDIEKADIIILLDTNTIQQLDEWAELVKAKVSSESALIVIDHHASHPETEKLATLCIADENASSTCEIVYKFFKELNIPLGENEAKALFLGIAFDTRHFILAGSTTLKTVAELIDVGINVQETLALLSLPMDFSERIARLKASQRVKLLKINEWIIAVSHVSAFQASAARALIGLGADVAIVAGQRGDAVRISLRSNRDFYKKTGVHLGREVAKPLGEYFHGMGGGHSVAAGMNGIGDMEACLKRCVRILKERLKATDDSTLI
ncbi:MAG: DHH family phosphoesterase [Candidatus Bathyarchaeia archaeon]